MSNGYRLPEGNPGYERIGNIADMVVFDRLPKALREAVNDSLTKWSATNILRGMQARNMSPEEVVALIRKHDEEI